MPISSTLADALAERDAYLRPNDLLVAKRYQALRFEAMADQTPALRIRIDGGSAR